MREYTLTTQVRVLTMEELTPEESRLVELAKKATYSSYSPYSHFCVGAALLLENGETVCGSNQENASFPVGCCAERTAMHYAGAHYPGVGIKVLAIAARDTSGEFTSEATAPCGMCRQALAEAEHRFGPIRILLYCTEGVHCIDSVSQLLPMTFTSESL